MRGKRKVNIIHAASVGITPADAGKTGGTKFAAAKIEDHPRGCGENRPKPAKPC